MTENEEFEAWWLTYLKSDECELKKTAWSYNEIGIIKLAMRDAYVHKVTIDESQMHLP